MSKLLGGSAAPAFKFEEPGDGFDDLPVVESRDVHQRDHDSQALLYWPATGSASRRPVQTPTDPATGEKLDPVLQLRVTVDTGKIDPMVEYDDGLRSAYFRGQSLDALRADLRRTRSREISPGGRLSMRLVELEWIDPKSGKKRGIAKKIYSAGYEPPAGSGTGEPVVAATGPAPAAGADSVPDGVDPVAYRAALDRLRRTASPTDEPPF